MSTPRTDAARLKYADYKARLLGEFPAHPDGWNFARILETELQAARAELQDYAQAAKAEADMCDKLKERAERAEQALAEAKIDVTRYRYWRENIDWLTEDEAGIKGCAYSCQIPLEIIKQASDAELFDAVADFEIEQAARAARSGA